MILIPMPIVVYNTFSLFELLELRETVFGPLVAYFVNVSFDRMLK